MMNYTPKKTIAQLIEEQKNSKESAAYFLSKGKQIAEIVRNEGNAIVISSADEMEYMDFTYYGDDSDIVFLLTQSICSTIDNMLEKDPVFAWACLQASISTLTEKLFKDFGGDSNEP